MRCRKCLAKNQTAERTSWQSKGDSMNQFDDSFHDSHELEATLRGLRPRAPQLDVDRLIEQPRRTSDPLGAVEAVRTQHPWLAVASAWACGAIAGGLAVFFVMQHRTETLHPIGKTSRQEVVVTSSSLPESVEPGPQTTNATLTVTYNSTRDWAVAAAALATTWDDGHAQSLSDVRRNSTLTAGSHLRPFAGHSSPADRDVMPVSSNRAKNSAFELNSENLHPPVTRAWLLEQLLST